MLAILAGAITELCLDYVLTRIPATMDGARVTELD